jgi:hypothetical protein
LDKIYDLLRIYKKIFNRRYAIQTDCYPVMRPISCGPGIVFLSQVAEERTVTAASGLAATVGIFKKGGDHDA